MGLSGPSLAFQKLCLQRGFATCISKRSRAQDLFLVRVRLCGTLVQPVRIKFHGSPTRLNTDSAHESQDSVFSCAFCLVADVLGSSSMGPAWLEASKALQGAECCELLNPMRASCWMLAPRWPGKLKIRIDVRVAPLVLRRALAVQQERRGPLSRDQQEAFYNQFKFLGNLTVEAYFPNLGTGSEAVSKTQRLPPKVSLSFAKSCRSTTNVWTQLARWWRNSFHSAHHARKTSRPRPVRRRR